MRIIAHRGARGLELENSLASLQAALTLDVDAIEFDVRRTLDNEFVVIHDSTTKRVADTNVPINKVTLKELREVRLKNGQPIPTLREVLSVIQTHPIFIDVKDEGSAEALAKLLGEYRETDVTFVSYLPNELRRLHELMPAAPTYLYFLKTRSPLARPFKMATVARDCRAQGIEIDKFYLLNPLAYYIARRRGLRTLAYSIGSLRLVRLLLLVYPNLDIITSHPDTITRQALSNKSGNLLRSS